MLVKVLTIGSPARTRKFLPDMGIVSQVDLVSLERGASDEDILSRAGDADAIIVDAISPVGAVLMEGMPRLKLVHSEGVAYNAIDLDAAKRRGIAVCNCAGVNAGAVAEHAIMLMLMCTRRAVEGDAAVRAGRQIQLKEQMMVEGFPELGDCVVGFVGFGAIARATALRLSPWGCRMLYNKRTRLSAQDEQALGVEYAELTELCRACDIVSLHVPVTPETTGMVDEAFLARMKEGSILINTARGDIVCQKALCSALESGHVAAAGLDVLTPEPVGVDNPLLNMSEAAGKRLVLTPHVAGVAEGMFKRAWRMAWENVDHLAKGETLERRVV